MRYHADHEPDPDGRATGGCYTTAEVVHVATGWDVGIGAVLRDGGALVVAEPGYWRSRRSHRDEYRDRPSRTA